jgi:hypothetical protein
MAINHIIKVINITNNTVVLYKFVRLAAKALGISHPTLLYINNNKLYKIIYKIIQ